MHVLVVSPAYAELIVAGVKTLESRLSRTRREPFGRVEPGDVLHIRAGGRYVAVARAGRVECEEGLTPALVRELRDRVEARVLGGRDYWSERLAARYATIVELTCVRACARGPSIAPLSGAGWRVLSASR